MNKLIVLMAVLLLLIGALSAGISQWYTFSASTADYSPITGTSVPSAVGDNVITTPVDIGFTFNYGQYQYTQVKISSDGYIVLGTIPGSSFTNHLASTTFCPVLAPLWDDLLIPATGGVQFLSEGTSPNRVFTIQYTGVHWNYSSAANSFDFQVKLFESGRIEFRYGNSSGTPANPSASIGINMQPGGTGNYYSVTPGNPATASSTQENNTVSQLPANGVVYAFAPPVSTTDDIAALTIEGNLTPTMGYQSIYHINISNLGTAALNAGAYYVQLMSGTTLLASISGPAIAAGADQLVFVPWMPTSAIQMMIYGRVVLPGDSNHQNDQTPVLNIWVQAAGAFIDPPIMLETHRIPLDFYWKNSLFETIFSAQEVFQTGPITGITLYNNFITNLTNMSINIWMGDTTFTDLSGGWIPSTQLTLVFSGNVNFPSGPNNIQINFQTPFPHGNSNLVMLYERVMDTQYYSASDYFYGTTIGANRSLKAFSDNTDYDPANPPAGATLCGEVPKTTFYLMADLFCTISGTVTSGGNFLPGATITTSNSVQQTTVSDAVGHYTFPTVFIGTNLVTCSNPGFYSQTQVVNILAYQEAEVDFDLVPLPVINLSGSVFSGDNMQPLAGAAVILSGGNTYNATTDAEGSFSFPGILPVRTYTYTITKNGYQTATGNINVRDSNCDLGDIVLNRLALPPTNVVAAFITGNTAVIINWQASETPDADYRVWRLPAGQETNESIWSLITPSAIPGVTVHDAAIQTLPNGTYLWAVKAIAMGNDTSVPAFSNPLIWSVPDGTISGNVVDWHSDPCFEANITAGGYSTCSDENGFYTLSVPPGTYTVTCTYGDLLAVPQNNIVVLAGQTTTVNFTMMEVNNNENLAVTATALQGCYPNPFRAGTVIHYAIKEPVPVSIDIINTRGQLIKRLLNETKGTGHFRAIWDGTDENRHPASAGLYFYKMQAGKYTSTRKMILLK